MSKVTDDPIEVVDHDWNSVRLKYLCEINPNSKLDKFDDDDTIEYVEISSVNDRGKIENTTSVKFSDAPSRAQRTVEDGDIIVSTVRTYLKAIAKVEDPPENLVVSSGFTVLRPKQEIHSEYIWRVLQSNPFINWIVANSEGVSYPAISASKLSEMYVPVPNKNKQEKICNIINSNMQPIESLISASYELLEWIERRRRSLTEELISEYDGVDDVKLKYVTKMLPGYAFSSELFSNVNNGTPLLRGINVDVGETSWEETVYWNTDIDEYSNYLLEPGDIVLAMDRPWVKNGMRIAQLEEEDCPALLVQRVLRIRTTEEILQEYARILLESLRFKQYFEPILTGVSVPHISKSQVGEFRIPLPPIKVQKSIVSEWQKFNSTKGELESEISNLIDTLVEKRQSFITTAVTGQIDVSDE